MDVSKGDLGRVRLAGNHTSIQTTSKQFLKEKKSGCAVKPYENKIIFIEQGAFDGYLSKKFSGIVKEEVRVHTYFDNDAKEQGVFIKHVIAENERNQTKVIDALLGLYDKDIFNSYSFGEGFIAEYIGKKPELIHVVCVEDDNFLYVHVKED